MSQKMPEDRYVDIGSVNTRYWTAGDEGKAVVLIHAQVAQERMPNVKVHIFDRCGHVPMIERAAEFNDLVLEFLAA